MDFVEELSRATETIREAPGRWPIGKSNTRRFLLWRFPFAVIYWEQESVVTIWAVAHGNRRPEYWAGRYSQIGMTQKNTTVRYSLSTIKKKIARGASRTRNDAPEATPIGNDFWKRARIVMPHGKTSVHLRIDSDVFDWFKKQGEGHLTRMNAVLRSYVDAQKH